MKNIYIYKDFKKMINEISSDEFYYPIIGFYKHRVGFFTKNSVSSIEKTK